MKRLICILLSCLLLFVSGAFAETATKPKETVHQIETKAYPFYMGSKEDKWPEDFPLYFLDGVYDLPYVDLNDWARVLNKLYPQMDARMFSGYQVSVEVKQESGRVTLLGRVSGGGSCVVQTMTTAWGTTFQISGSKRISFVKNGAYYDVDQGVEPDFIINSYDHFFDREALTEFIHGLY